MSRARYPRMKRSGVEWLGDVPSHWEICQSRRMFAVRSEPALPDDRVLTASQKYGVLYQDEFVEREGRRVVEVILGVENLKHVEPNDFIISMRSFQGGIEWCQLRGSTSFHYVMIRPLKHVYPPFFAYLLKSASYIQALRSTSDLIRDGQELRYSNFVQVPLPVIPMAEQRAIADYLDHEKAKIDTLIEEQRRLIELLKEQRRAVVSHAVTKGLDPSAPMKDSGVEWLGEVPAHWKVGPIKRFASFLDGKRVPLSTAERTGRGGPYPYYGASGIIDHIDEFIFSESLVLVSEDGANLLKRSTPIAFVATGKYWVNNHAHILRPLDLCVAYWAARIDAVNVTPFVTGSAQPKFTVEALANLLVAAPSDREEIRAIEQHIDRTTKPLSDLLERANVAILLLQERRAALISAAVTGKIDVRESTAALAEPDSLKVRVVVFAEAVARLKSHGWVGRTTAQKVFYLAEAHVGITEIQGHYIRAAAGPYDGEMMELVESHLEQSGALGVTQSKGPLTPVTYTVNALVDTHRRVISATLGPRSQRLIEMIDKFAGISTRGIEAVATLYAVWNDALIDGSDIDDPEKIRQFLDEWHPKKKENFGPDELQTWLDWMRRQGIVPSGRGPKTTTGRLFP